MQSKIKKRIMGLLGLSRVQKKDWYDIYTNLLEHYSEEEIPKVIEMYHMDVLLFMPKARTNKKKLENFAKGLIGKESDYRSKTREKFLKDNSISEYYIPSEFRPSVDGVQVHNGKKWFEKIHEWSGA